jgi:hypothetical protein
MTKRIMNEKEYWNISYIKRVTYKIRSARSPLIMGLRKEAELGGFGRNLKRFLDFWFWGVTSEKGSTRKDTGKRVTRWGFVFWRNLVDSRWFTKRILLGEFLFGIFWDLGGFPRGATEEGDQWCALLEFIGVNWIDFGGGRVSYRLVLLCAWVVWGLGGVGEYYVCV